MTDHSSAHATFSIERTYAAPPATVFQAFADPAVKRRWFIDGDGWRIDDFQMDFRVGGIEFSRFRFEDGPPWGNDTIYLDIVQNRRIIFTYAMINDGRRISSSQATIEIEPDGAGSRLRYTEQAAFLDGLDNAKSREEGWVSLLATLGDELSGDRAAA